MKFADLLILRFQNYERVGRTMLYLKKELAYEHKELTAYLVYS